MRGFLYITAALLVACGSDTTPAAPDAALPIADAGVDAAPPPDAAPTPDPAKLTPDCFGGGAAPQLDLSGPIANWTWNDPHVLRTGDEYWMYASATDAFQFPVRLYRLTSTDGAAWAANEAPILDVGAPGTWDDGGVETPAVVEFAGQYHLFYTGYSPIIGDPMHGPDDFRIGHAVSDDGVAFARAGADPIVSPSGTNADASDDWYAFIVGEPGPVVVGDTLLVYFTAVGAHPELGALQVIGVTTTTDGVTWSPPQLVLEPDQDLYPRSDDWIGYSTPNAIALSDGVHLFFDVANQPDGGDWRQVRLHHARSADGVTGWTHDVAPIRAAGDYDWAVDEVRSPDALLDGTTLRLYFAGHELDGVQPEHFAVGMLTCEL